MTTVKREARIKGDAILSNDVKDRVNDPYFVKKAEEAKKILRKVGIPETKGV